VVVEVVDLSLLQQDQDQVDQVVVELVVELQEQQTLAVVAAVEYTLVEQVELEALV
tara:strand:- start:57 stop:224 length:168 start_codon:yes stop_codon:yes gene_type:complete